MIVGNGYVPGHAELTLELLRRQAGLRKLFEQRYVSSTRRVNVGIVHSRVEGPPKARLDAGQAPP